MCLLYLLWLDIIISLLPLRWQERFYSRLAPSDEAEEELVEMPGMLPFGPFLAIGAQLALLLGEPLAHALRSYLEWAGF
jgi:prepilin signal peptidase PulO-like enzyme (type II secretory pathway)